ncbi:hypothetical protein [Paraburkholderia graminis]|uniref:hypothetical protein n=1 Tax=Paraburkholderia graminis TaxID=60548 RepID=UPI0038BC95C1
MKVIVRVGLAALLTPFVFIGLSRMDPLARWVGSDAVWTALTPLFRLFGVVGTEGEENVVLAALLAASFLIAAIVVWIGSILLRHRRARRALR